MTTKAESYRLVVVHLSCVLLRGGGGAASYRAEEGDLFLRLNFMFGYYRPISHIGHSPSEYEAGRGGGGGGMLQPHGNVKVPIFGQKQLILAQNPDSSLLHRARLANFAALAGKEIFGHNTPKGHPRKKLFPFGYVVPEIPECSDTFTK